MRLVAVLPALDEEATIAAVVEGVAPFVDEVIVVDNGSGDATAPRAAAAGARVVAEPRRGYGAACLAGALAAPEGALLVYLDADGSDDPAALVGVAAPVLAGEADLVLGSRVRGRREPGALAPHQLAANRAIASLVRLRWRLPVTDIGPMRAIARERLLGLALRSRTHAWPVEMLVAAARAGLRVEEVPVDTRRRAGGRSKVAGSVRGSAKAGVRLIGALLRS